MSFYLFSVLVCLASAFSSSSGSLAILVEKSSLGVIAAELGSGVGFVFLELLSLLEGLLLVSSEGGRIFSAEG